MKFFGFGRFSSVASSPDTHGRPWDDIREQSDDFHVTDDSEVEEDLAWLFDEGEEAVQDLGPSKYGRSLTLEQMTKLADFCTEFADTVTAGARGIFGETTLRPYQRAFCWSVAFYLLTGEGGEVCGEWARQMGKTEAIGSIAGPLGVLLPILARHIPDERIKRFTRGLWVGFYAPISEQALTPFSRMHEQMTSHTAKMALLDPEISTVWPDDEEKKRRKSVLFRIPQTNSLFYYSGMPKQRRIEGKTWHLAIIDEAQDTDSMIVKKSIHPMLAQTGGLAVKTGVAGQRRCDFLDALKRCEKEDLKLSDRRRQRRFHYDFRVGAKYSQWYRNHVRDQRRIMGYDSDEFKLAYRLIWMLEYGQAIPEHWVEVAELRDQGLVTQDRTRPYVVGIDVGRVQNPTVVTVGLIDDAQEFGSHLIAETVAPGEIRAHKVILNWFETRGDDYPEQLEKVVNFLRNYWVRMIVCDSTGVGSGFFDILRRHFANSPVTEVIGYDFNRKEALYQRYIEEWGGQRMHYASSDRAMSHRKWRKFKQQHIELEKELGENRRIKFHRAKDIPGSKDDYCDSGALFCWAEQELHRTQHIIQGSPTNPLLDKTRRGGRSETTPAGNLIANPLMSRRRGRHQPNENPLLTGALGQMLNSRRGR